MKLPFTSSDASSETDAPASSSRSDAMARTATVASGNGAAVPTGGKRTSKGGGSSPKPSDTVLGVHVTPRTIYAVLTHEVDGEVRPLRQFVRSRSEQNQPPTTPEVADSPFGTPTPGTQDIQLETDGEVTVRFGDTGSVDLEGEFGSLSANDEFDPTSALEAAEANASGQAVKQTILFEVKDILEECREAGYEAPALSFTVGDADVDYQEVVVPPNKKRKGDAAEDASDEAEVADVDVKRDRLLSLLPAAEGEVDPKTIVFQRMTPHEGRPRYLAIRPKQGEPVLRSLAMLREQSSYRKIACHSLQAEVPMLAHLAGRVSPAEVEENVAVVRVGTEDTIVILLRGGHLDHVEPMPSVSTFDSPETICSRVLLQQDVQGVGTIHHVMVAAEEREEDLVNGFAAFYPEAEVETLRGGLARIGLRGPHGPLASTLAGASGAAVAGHFAKKEPYDNTNMLPKSLRKGRGRIDLSFGWHTLVVAGLLFLSVLFFVGFYLRQESQIAEAEQRLAEYPPQARMEVPELQARIDSLRGVQQRITATMGELDSLLIGTDRWTQALLQTSQAANASGGIWIEDWQPGGNTLTVRGFSTSRSRVVSLAQRLDAEIESLTFQEVREYPVYNYQMRFDLPSELPQVVQVLRENEPGPSPEGASSTEEAVALDMALETVGEEDSPGTKAESASAESAEVEPSTDS